MSLFAPTTHANTGASALRPSSSAQQSRSLEARSGQRRAASQDAGNEGDAGSTPSSAREPCPKLSNEQILCVLAATQVARDHDEGIDKPTLAKAIGVSPEMLSRYEMIDVLAKGTGFRTKLGERDYLLALETVVKNGRPLDEAAFANKYGVRPSKVRSDAKTLKAIQEYAPRY
ncbi:hypothetical protein [Pandoraea horticolens]|nr:hypothetical protein [Pandoraea horticolens]